MYTADTTGKAKPADQHPDDRVSGVPPGAGWRPRSEAELLHDQLRGIDLWTQQHAVWIDAESTAEVRRELRLDLRRQSAVRRAEHQALLDRAREQLRAGAALLGYDRPRAVLAHRDDWFRGKVAARLAARGVRVLASTADGAYASGVVVVEQPDIVFVQDRLPTLTGLQVLDRTRAFSPATTTAAQLLDTTELPLFQQHGVRALFTRRVPPAQVADLTLDCLLFARSETVV